MARLRYPQPPAKKGELEPAQRDQLPRSLWIYLAGSGLIALGYADFPLIAFHLKRAGVASDTWIPLLYAVAMGTDALAALGFGRLFDRYGNKVLLGAPLAAVLAAPLAFSGSFRLALAGMVLWGIGMGVQESVLRAAVAEMAPLSRRGFAYGAFNTAYGVCWFAGSAAMGVLYSTSPPHLVVFSICAQLAAIPLLLRSTSRDRGHRTASGDAV
jgi:MFS family permease